MRQINRLFLHVESHNSRGIRPQNENNEVVWKQQLQQNVENHKYNHILAAGRLVKAVKVNQKTDTRITIIMA